MKASTFTPFLSTSIFLCMLAVLMPSPGQAQFQKHYGTALDNAFSKVVKDGADYYVLGSDEATEGTPHRATVTRLNSNGAHQWTLSMNTPSRWADALLMPGGDLLVVGYTLPFDASTKSLIGRVTQSGTFMWLKTYDEPGRDFFNRIAEQAGNYYVLAGEIEFGGSFDNVALWNFAPSGTLNWKKYYISSADDEFVRDLVAIPGGGLLMAGNDANGVIYTTDNAGEMTTTAVRISNRVFRDVEANSSGGFYAVATNFPTGEGYLQKFDAGLLLLWEVRINELNAISQVWEGLPGDLYVTGTGTFGGQLRNVIIKLNDDPNNGLSVAWVKYLHAGAGQTGGSAWHLVPLELAYTDARTLPGGFGQTCANLSVSDLDLSDACEVTMDNATLLFTDPLPDGPPIYFAEEVPPSNMGEILKSSSLNWQEEATCERCSCDSMFVHAQPIPGESDTCYFVMQISTGPGFCADYIDIELEAGTIAEATLLDGDFIVEVLDSQLVRITPSSGTWCSDWTCFVFHRLGIVGSGIDTFDIQINSIAGQGGPNCSRSLSLPCPVPSGPAGCCPANMVQTGNELVIDGDFGANSTGQWVNDYHSIPPYNWCVGGTAAVVTGASFPTLPCYHPYWHSAVGKSGDLFNDYFLVVNDGGWANSALPPPIAWSQSITVQPGKHYSFSAWVNNIINIAWGYDPKIQLQIIDPTASPPNNIVASTSSVLNYAPDWEKICLNWQAPNPTNATSSYIFEIRNLESDPYGNDWALDCISLQECVPACTCDSTSYSDITYRPEQGVPNIPVVCGDTLIAKCDGITPWAMGGNFVCTGTSCPDTTQMFWMLTAPNGSMSSGSMVADAGFNFTIPAADFSETGCYDLALKALCGTDTCRCDFVIKVECDTCCTSLEDFCERLDNSVSVSVDSALCKATLNIGDIGCGGYVDMVYWDYPNFPTPVPPGTNPMHTYPGSGTYVICYYAAELDTAGFICFEKIVCDTIVLVCDSCKCAEPEGLTFSSSINGGPLLYNFMASCDNQMPLELPCPVDPNQTFNFQGFARCLPDSCLGSDYNWTVNDLTPPATGLFGGSGTFGANGHFDIQVAYSQLVPGVLYEVGLTYFCGDEECTCGVKFIIEECDTCCMDYNAFCQNIENATSVSTFDDVCKATLNIGNLPCDDYIQSVDWGDGSTSTGPFPSGSMPMHTYSNSGTYVISYVAIEVDPATGMVCFDKILTDTISLGCLTTCPKHYIIKLEPCRYRTSISDSSPGCHQSATFLLDVGSFGNLAANSADGWIVEQITSAEILLTHADGTFPPDSNWVFEFEQIDPGLSPATFSILTENTCSTENCQDNLTLDCLATATSNLEQDKGIRLYPNPTSGGLTLQFMGTPPKAGSVQVFDLYGRLLQNQALLPGQPIHQFSVGALTAGMYFVQVLEDGVPIWAERIVKQ